MAAEYAAALALRVDGAAVALRPRATRVTTPPASAGLVTLRLETDLTGPLPPSTGARPRRVYFADANHAGRAGWNEIVVAAAPGVSVFDSSAYGNSASDELRRYPEGLAGGALDERAATWSFSVGPPPPGAEPLRSRAGAPASPAPDRLAALIAVPQLTPGAALLGILFAALLGGLHGLSPGHGKTVVAAYLVGSRGSAARGLGLTVTVTHTLGVLPSACWRSAPRSTSCRSACSRSSARRRGRSCWRWVSVCSSRARAPRCERRRPSITRPLTSTRTPTPPLITATTTITAIPDITTATTAIIITTVARTVRSRIRTAAASTRTCRPELTAHR
jgi:hypothetical protein